MTTSDSRVCTAQVRQGGTCTKNIFSLAVLRISSEVGLGLPLFNALRRQKLATFLGSRTHKKWPLGLFKTNSLTTVICEFLSLFFFFRLLVLLFLFRLFFSKIGWAKESEKTYTRQSNDPISQWHCGQLTVTHLRWLMSHDKPITLWSAVKFNLQLRTCTGGIIPQDKQYHAPHILYTNDPL